ncbi:MAG: bifunctional diguanylate cyclase/phosphodiesterase [Erysipelotrichaceae bacterium]|nr:bifunctional diguanylate cyclase/phosphodiesterase [Erysipelotrichaceae bacterium]
MKHFNDYIKIWTPSIVFLTIHIPMAYYYPLWARVVTPLAFFIIALSISKVVKHRTRNHKTALFIMLSVITFGLAESIWIVQENVFHIDPTKDIFLNILYIIPNFFILSAIMAFIWKNRIRWHKSQFVLDLLVTMFLTIGTVFILFYDADFFGNVQNDIQSTTAFVYLVLDALAISFTFTVFISSRSFRVDIGYIILIVALLSFSIADIIYVSLVLNNNYSPYEFADWLYMAAFLLMSNGLRTAYFHYTEYQIEINIEKYYNEGSIWTSIWLLFFPISVVVLHGINLNEVIYFSVILITYFLVSFSVQSNISKGRLLEEKDKYSSELEGKILERTTELRNLNNKLEYIIRHDSLTDLVSRDYYFEIIDDQIISANKYDPFYIILIKVDHFKLLNDTYSHKIIDKLLIQLTKRITKTLPLNTIVARTSSAEFSILIKKKSQEKIKKIVDNISFKLNQPYIEDPFSIILNFNVGIVCYPKDATTSHELFQCAGAAIEFSKTNRSNRCAFYNIEYHKLSNRKQIIKQSLLSANYNAEFNLHYQPIYSSDGKRLIGMEALVRWEHPINGLISPIEFILIAEETGIIINLGNWIMERAMKQIHIWNTKYGTNLKMSINISPIQIEDSKFIDAVKLLINELNVDPSWIIFEITENAAITYQNYISSAIQTLSSLGIQFAIDDFGTGYSSFLYLKKYSIDYLKIDKVLIDNLIHSSTDRQIVQAIILMSKALGIKTIAEGVEVEAQAEIINDLGCDQVQGYFLGRPVECSVFENDHIMTSTFPVDINNNEYNNSEAIFV